MPNSKSTAKGNIRRRVAIKVDKLRIKRQAAVSKNTGKRKPAPAVVTSKKTAGALANAARIALVDCMAVQPGETVMILTDVNKRNIGVTLWQVAKELNTEAILVEMTPRARNGEEPPAPVAAMMAMSSVVLCPTTKSFTQTSARRDAVARDLARCNGRYDDSLPERGLSCYCRAQHSTFGRAAESRGGSRHQPGGH